MQKWLALGVLALMALPLAAAAATPCTAPARPVLPGNAAGLSRAALHKLANEVNTYARAMQAYQECLDQIITDPASYTHAQWRAALKAYNTSAPALEDTWAAYQNLSRAWEAAHRGKAGKARQ